MTVRKAFIGGIALAAASLSACGGGSPESDVVMVEVGDEKIAAARAEARKTLPQFWERLENPTIFESNFGVKFNLHHEKPELGEGELIWTSDVSKDGDTITARLANVPMTEGYTEGQVVQFSEDAIVDWQIERNGKFEGHYSTRVLLAMVSPEEAEMIKSRLW